MLQKKSRALGPGFDKLIRGYFGAALAAAGRASGK